MKKLKKIIKCLIPIVMCVLSVINIYAYTISVNDFKPKTNVEKGKGHYGHTAIGSWNNGKFFETVTWAVTGYDAETGKQKVRIRYYITHRGGTGSYIYQKVPVAIDLDGKKIATFKDWQSPNKHIANKTQMCGEKTITLNPGSHTIELYDATGGAITKVNVKFTFNVPQPKFTVRFLGWDGTVLDTQTVTKGKNATPPTPPNRPGYHFVKWDKSYTNITKDTDIKAQYEINQYTVRFVDWNGTVLKTQTVSHGSNAAPPGDPWRAGYTFTGWSGSYTNITSDRTITATYSINYYDVRTNHWVWKDTTPGAWNPSGTVNSSGNMILHGTTQEQSLSYGSIFYPKPTSIEGYELSSDYYGYNAPGGWTSKPNGTGLSVLQYVGAEYYYKKKAYTVTFVTNGGSAVPSQSILYRNKATYPTPTKRNFKFIGWYSDNSLNTRFDPNTPITGNTTVYAKWERTHYDITYSHRTYDVVNGWKTIRNESRQLPVNSVLPISNLNQNDIPIGYQPENKYDLYKGGNKVDDSYPFSQKQSVNGTFDTVVVRYNATPAEIKAKDTYYFQNEVIKSNDLIQRAKASDVKDGNISNKIFVDKIKYPDKTVNRPDKLETSKCQTVIVTFGVTNSRGVTSYANANFHVVRRGSDLEEDTDDAKIYARFISDQVLVDGTTPLSKLPANSVWRRPEFAEVLHRSLANDTPLAEYDYINKPGVESYMKSVNPGEDANRDFVSRFK